MIKKVYLKIAFKKIVKDSDIVEKAIGIITKSNYCHCELVINDTWVSSNSKEGVTIKEDFDYYADEWDFYEFPVLDIMTRDFNIIMDFIRKQDDKTYDFLGIILSQLVPISVHNRKKYFCSEITVRVLQLFLIEEVLDVVPNNASPGDVAKIFNMEQ